MTGRVREVAKQPVAKVKLHVVGGQADPAPPVGPALGPHQVNIGEFVRQFNERTRAHQGITIPVVISIYSDRTFDFITKSPPAADLLKRAAGLAKGSASPPREKVGTVTWQQLEEIVKQKADDLNTSDVEAGCRIIAGTARGMGIDVEGGPSTSARVKDPGE